MQMSKGIKPQALTYYNNLAYENQYRRLLLELNAIPKRYIVNTDTEGLDVGLANYIDTIKHGIEFVYDDTNTFHYYAYPRVLDKSACLDAYCEMGVLNSQALPFHVTNVMSLGLPISYLTHYFYHEEETEFFGSMDGIKKIYRPNTDGQIVDYWLKLATEEEIEYIRQNIHDRDTVLLFQPYLVKYL